MKNCNDLNNRKLQFVFFFYRIKDIFFLEKLTDCLVSGHGFSNLCMQSDDQILIE